VKLFWLGLMCLVAGAFFVLLQTEELAGYNHTIPVPGEEMSIMSDTEKITINLGPVDLGRIDVLVEQGIYSNRTDLIRTAIRNQLEKHEPVIEEVGTRQNYSIGVIVMGPEELMSQRAKGKKISIHILGMLTLTSGVTPELALETIDSIWIRGKLIAPKEVREALSDRINTGK